MKRVSETHREIMTTENNKIIVAVAKKTLSYIKIEFYEAMPTYQHEAAVDYMASISQETSD